MYISNESNLLALSLQKMQLFVLLPPPPPAPTAAFCEANRPLEKLYIFFEKDVVHRTDLQLLLDRRCNAKIAFLTVLQNIIFPWGGRVKGI
jgi:hypothetical protein